MEVGQAAVMAVVGSHLVAGRVAQHENVLDVLLADRLPRRLGEHLHHCGIWGQNWEWRDGMWGVTQVVSAKTCIIILMSSAPTYPSAEPESSSICVARASW